jgi:hypothetical protein
VKATFLSDLWNVQPIRNVATTVKSPGDPRTATVSAGSVAACWQRRAHRNSSSPLRSHALRLVLRDSNCIDGVPGVETPGYSQDVPSGHRSTNSRNALTPTHAANLSVNRTKFRQVLDCASPPAFAARQSAAPARRRLALFQRRCANRKRQRTAAVQDAVAPNAPSVIPQSSSLSLFLLTAVAVTTCSLLILCPASAHAQGGVPLWTNRYPGPPADSAPPAHIAVDSSGNVFVSVTSHSRRQLTVGYASAAVPPWTNLYTRGDLLAIAGIRTAWRLSIRKLFAAREDFHQ